MLKKLKRYICILLTAAMVMMFTPVVGIMVSAETSGTGWSFDETTETLTITTNGGTTAWRSSCDKKLVQSIEIQEGVTSIGGSAFSGCTALVSIEIPDSVKSIGSQAFSSCYKLESIKIPDGVTSIGLMTFWDCLDLASIEIPDSVTSIENFAFVGCRSLESIEIPNSVISIGWSAFYDCKGLASMEIPNSVESIGGAAFEGCSSLTSIVIPDSVTSVGNDVFESCSSLDSIIYPSGLDVSSASIPDTTTQVEYTDNNGEVTITEIILGSGKTKVEIPNSVSGKNVTGTAADIRDKVSSNGHTHQSEKTVTLNPTETEEGIIEYRCKVCGTVTGTEAIPALGGGSETPSEPTFPVISVKPVTPSQPDNGIPFIKSDNEKTGWDAIKLEAENADGGSVITVDMNGTAIVPKNIFDTLNGRDVTVIFDIGENITWSVNGKDITSDKTSDIDFSVNANTENIPVDVINNITGERYSIQISLAHNGEFGFTAVLSINLGSDNAGQKAALYYYNNGALELMYESEIYADGTTRLAFTHTSDYLIVIDAKSSGNAEKPNNGGETGKPDTEDGNPKTGDTRQPWKIMLLGSTATVIGVLSLKRNRFQAK